MACESLMWLDCTLVMLLQLEVKADLIRMAGESELDFAVFACFEEFEISFKIFLSSLTCLWSSSTSFLRFSTSLSCSFRNSLKLSFLL